MNVLARIATALFIAAVPVFLVTANIRFAAGDSWFSRHGFRQHDASATTRVSQRELDLAADDIIRYFEDDRTTLRIPVTIDGEETQLFSEEETSHMRDVKGLMRAVFRLNEASLAVLLAYTGAVVLWSRERTPRDLAKYTLLGVALGFIIVAVVGAFALTGFDQAWTTFHELAFRNDLWRLDPDRDRLIQMFPEPFWREMTFVVAALTVGEALALVGLASGYLVVSRERRQSEALSVPLEAERRAS